MNLIEQLNAFPSMLFKYLADAFGVRPEEPPIVSDYPPIHAVDGEIKLGDE